MMIDHVHVNMSHENTLAIRTLNLCVQSNKLLFSHITRHSDLDKNNRYVAFRSSPVVTPDTAQLHETKVVQHAVVVQLCRAYKMRIPAT